MKASAIAPANIAFIKYWGRKDHRLFLPLTTTNSMNLSACIAHTTVEFSPSYESDQIDIVDTQGKRSPVQRDGGAKDKKLFEQLGRIRELSGVAHCAKVESKVNFPLDAGVASSAAGLCAFTSAALLAAGLREKVDNLEELSREVRLTGSVSAARSTHDGFTEHRYGEDHEGAYTAQIASDSHWDLVDLVAIVDQEKKKISSSLGHELAHTSPFLNARIADMPPRIAVVREAILNRDLPTLGEAMEKECINMHAVMMTSTPSALYLMPGSISLMHEIPRLREDGLPAYFTIDAGPNIHVICEGKYAAQVRDFLKSSPYVHTVIKNKVAPGMRIVEEHLF